MAILALTGAAGAAVQQGDTELEFLGGFLSQSGPSDGADVDAWFASGAFNYFFSDNLSVGFGGFGSQMDLATGLTTSVDVDAGEGLTFEAQFRNVEQDITVYGVGANVKLHLAPTNQWVPYIGAQIRWVSAEVDTSGDYVAETGPGTGEFTDPAPFDETTDLDGIMYGPLVGVRVELNEYNDLFVEGQYQLWGGDIGDLLDNGFGVFVGIVHQFQ